MTPFIVVRSLPGCRFFQINSTIAGLPVSKRNTIVKENFFSYCSVMATPKDLTNRIIFVLLIGFIGWQLLRLGLIVGVANGWM